MITLNITLLVQVVHFVVAYTIMRVFLWRPLLAIIQRQEQSEVELNAEIKKQQELVQHKEYELKKLWVDARQTFGKAMPPVVDNRLFKLIGPRAFKVQLPHVSDQQIDNLVRIITRKVHE